MGVLYLHVRGPTPWGRERSSGPGVATSSPVQKNRLESSMGERERGGRGGLIFRSRCHQLCTLNSNLERASKDSVWRFENIDVMTSITHAVPFHMLHCSRLQPFRPLTTCSREPSKLLISRFRIASECRRMSARVRTRTFRLWLASALSAGVAWQRISISGCASRYDDTHATKHTRERKAEFSTAFKLIKVEPDGLGIQRLCLGVFRDA
jgi:hypothetical protein